ncbi:MAG: A/G-specific adenine glycosylase [Candidatus Aminicenantales bacterium]
MDFSIQLIRWYHHHRRSLPWRKTTDPYRIWVSEIMLQQTTVNAVIPYFEKWLKLFPDVRALAGAPVQKVLKAWQGLGYYQRAKNLHSAAQIILKKYQGRIPRDYAELAGLPGFGPYITAAVLSLAFDKPFPVMEANVRRVMMRIVRLRGEAVSKNDKILLSHLGSYFPQKNFGVFNQALMELGALICRARNPLCLQCPVQPFCQAYSHGEQEVIPRPRKRSTRRIEAVVGIIQKEGQYLIQKRPSSGLLADLWEFPGGKRRTRETLLHTLHREIKEELGAEVKQARLLTKVRHSYTQFQVSLYVYECRLKNAPRFQHKRQRWVKLSSLRNYPLPSGSAKIVRFLESLKKKSGSRDGFQKIGTCP